MESSIATLAGASIHRFSSTGLLFLTIAMTGRTASASFTSLVETVLSCPDAAIAEGIGVDFPLEAFVAVISVNRKAGEEFRAALGNERLYMQFDDHTDNRHRPKAVSETEQGVRMRLDGHSPDPRFMRLQPSPSFGEAANRIVS